MDAPLLGLPTTEAWISVRKYALSHGLKESSFKNFPQTLGPLRLSLRKLIRLTLKKGLSSLSGAATFAGGYPFGSSTMQWYDEDCYLMCDINVFWSHELQEVHVIYRYTDEELAAKDS